MWLLPLFQLRNCGKEEYTKQLSYELYAMWLKERDRNSPEYLQSLSNMFTPSNIRKHGTKVRLNWAAPHALESTGELIISPYRSWRPHITMVRQCRYLLPTAARVSSIILLSGMSGQRDKFQRLLMFLWWLTHVLEVTAMNMVSFLLGEPVLHRSQSLMFLIPLHLFTELSELIYFTGLAVVGIVLCFIGHRLFALGEFYPSVSIGNSNEVNLFLPVFSDIIHKFIWL